MDPSPWGNASTGEASNALMLLGEGESETLTSTPTTDLPSTKFDEEEEAQEDPVLAFNNQRGPPGQKVQAPRVPYAKGTQAATQRPGWEAPRSPLRTTRRKSSATRVTTWTTPPLLTGL